MRVRPWGEGGPKLGAGSGLQSNAMLERFTSPLFIPLLQMQHVDVTGCMSTVYVCKTAQIRKERGVVSESDP